MEIYRNAQDAVVTLQVPVAATGIDVWAVENGKVIHELQTVTTNGAGTWSVTLPWFLTRQDREFNLVWKFTWIEEGQTYELLERSLIKVVTPLLSLDEIARIAELTLPIDKEQVLDLERKVRFAVQSYAGMNFGKFYGAMTVSGNGSNKLALPAPLLEFVGLSFDGILRPNYGILVSSDQLSLTSGEIEISSIKQAPPEWMLDRFDYDGKIRAPIRYSKNYFLDGVQYTIEGLWGFADVPGDVQQAARLLVRDYSCDESLWRDRYITSVQAADWRLQFNSQSLSGTGNVQADNILSGYRRQTMAVI